MPFLLVIKLTVVLSLGTLFLAIPRVLSPAARHFLCLVSLAVSLLLPFTPSVAPLPALALLPNVSSLHTAAAMASQGSLNWIRILWVSGMLLITARFAFGLLVMWRRASSAAPMRGVPEDLQALSENLSIKVKIAPVDTPLVWG